MTTRSFLVNLLEIVDEARLRIPIVRDIKLPGFWLVMECFLPSTPPLAVLLSPSLSLSFTFVRSCIRFLWSPKSRLQRNLTNP